MFFDWAKLETLTAGMPVNRMWISDFTRVLFLALADLLVNEPWRLRYNGEPLTEAQLETVRDTLDDLIAEVIDL